MQPDERLFEDYARFHAIQLANRDVDPVYPVLREIAELCGWTPEERVRAVFLHVAYYDLGSALAAFEEYRDSRYWDQCAWMKLTIGTERRRHRMGGNLRVHLASVATTADCEGGFLPWLEAELTSDAVHNWQLTTEKLMCITGNGRWAAFKTCEMLAEVCGFPLRAPDMGHKGSTGPRQGLTLLYPGASAAGTRPAVINQLNALSAQLVAQLQARGLDASLETAETTLCDFHSMVHGRYYPGLDIDVMLEQLDRAPMSIGMFGAAVGARMRTLPHAYLGEQYGWRKPDRKRKRIYLETGNIPVRGESS